MKIIHPTAIIAPGARLGKDVSVGPYSIIDDDVIIGDHCQISAYVNILPGARIGKECKIFQHAVIGEIPQDLKFHGEESTAEIGDRTTIREFVTINRGTEDRKKTTVGSDCLLMAYSHVAHDCIIGDRVILANAANLGGHVVIEDWAIIGGMVGIHQFVHVGRHSLIGGGFRTGKDIPPYVIAGGEPISYKGLNTIGLKRRGFTKESIDSIKKAYRIIYNSKHITSDALKILKEDSDISKEVSNIIDFFENSDHAIIR